MPTRPQVPTETALTPDTRIEVTYKTRLSYGDTKRVYKVILGDTSVNEEGERKKTPLSLSSAQELATDTLMNIIVAWDVIEEDGSPVTLTKENMDDIFTSDDVDFLMEKISPSLTAKKKEG